MPKSNDKGGMSGFHAGFPNPAVDAVDIPLDLNKLVVKHPSSTYYMRFEGNDAEPLGIYDGDILVIDRAESIGKGSLVIAGIDGELQLISSKTAKAEKTNEIWGVVTYVLHKVKA